MLKSVVFPGTSFFLVFWLPWIKKRPDLDLKWCKASYLETSISSGSKKVLFINDNSPKMGKWAKKAVKTDIWQWVVDEVKNHLEPLFGTRLEV